MSYVLLIIALYALSVFWISVAGPWLDEQIADADRWRKEQELRRKARLPKPNKNGRIYPPPDPEDLKVGKFLKFAFPIIRRANVALIAEQIVSVQPMTGPVGGVAFYRPSYGEPEELRTVLDDMVDALIESDNNPTDEIVEQIMRDTFGDCPYSSYYRPSVEELKEMAADAEILCTPRMVASAPC